MSLGFFKVIKYLYPRSKAFRNIADNNFRKFLSGMAYGPDDVQEYLENIYGDLFPETTRELDKWEEQFGVVFAKQYDEAIRRKLLKSFWNINTGGQSTMYLQDILELISPDFKVIENLPVRDPRDSNAVYAAVNGNKLMVNGNKYAVNGRKLGDSSFIPSVLKNDTEGFYSLPSQSAYWANCFFICKSVIRKSHYLVSMNLQLMPKSAVVVGYEVVDTIGTFFCQSR
jgi:hypothetical protein